jgi:hypothetical protein
MDRLDAYYYSFDPTGNEDVDKLLSAIARASKAFYSTADWTEECEWLGGKSYIDLIQERAQVIADKLTAVKESDE